MNHAEAAAVGDCPVDTTDADAVLTSCAGTQTAGAIPPAGRLLTLQRP
jgi:hypothetical protein